MKILLFIFLSSSVLAQDQCIEIPKAIGDISAVHEHLEWISANEKQIRSAPCVTNIPPEKETISAIIKKNQQTKVNGSVHGVKLKDDPKLIKHFKELTTAMDSFGWEPVPANQTKIQAKYKINPDCSTVECAVKKIWGEEMGPKILYLKLKHGYNASELAFQNSARFKEDELDDVLMGVDDLPSHITPLGKNQRLTHFSRGNTLAYYGADNTVAANAVIMLFDLWDANGRKTRQYAIFHELSHNISSKLGKMDSNPQWLALSKWIKKGDKWKSGTGACFVSKYGEGNPGEDWAESLSSYRYNGAEFKKNCPQKYDFLKKKAFKNVEYTDSYACSELPKVSVQKAHLAMTTMLINTELPTTISSDQILQNCTGQFSSYPPLPVEKENCSFELMLAGNSEALKKILKDSLISAGITDNQRNRNILLSSLSEDPASKKLLSDKLSGLDEEIQKIVDESIVKAAPASPLEIDDLDLWVSSQKCGKEFFGTSMSVLNNCLAKNIVEDDIQWQQFGGGTYKSYPLPEIFTPEAKSTLDKKRTLKLTELTINDQNFITESKKTMQKFKEDLNLQYKMINLNISSASVTSSPAEYCSKTYGRASFTLTQFGYKEGDEVPRFQQWCETIQATSPQRFKIPQSDWDKFAEELTTK